jgi:hypothetical protein
MHNNFSVIAPFQSSFRRTPESSFTHFVMAGLDPAISGQRQMRGSRPRMTKVKWGEGKLSS